jgi:hypothetical protein
MTASMTSNIPEATLREYLAALPDALEQYIPDAHPLVLSTTAATDLPVSLPLAWPSPLHQLNFITVLYVSYTILSQEAHAEVIAEAGGADNETASDIALRGCMGAYLASSESWDDAANYLSARAWRAGVLNNARVVDLFGISEYRERQHETLPIQVGERYAPAVQLVEELVGMFQTLGDKISSKCLAEDVVQSLKNSGALPDGLASVDV